MQNLLHRAGVASLLLFLALSLQACGGGGGDATPTTPGAGGRHPGE